MKKILIVEDNSDIIECFKCQLERYDFEVEYIRDNFENCLNTIAKIKPDVILMDIDLNSDAIDGVDLSRRIRGKIEICKTPIIILTCEADEICRENVINNSFCEAFLYKTVDIADLITVIKMYI